MEIPDRVLLIFIAGVIAGGIYSFVLQRFTEEKPHTTIFKVIGGSILVGLVYGGWALVGAVPLYTCWYVFFAFVAIGLFIAFWQGGLYLLRQFDRTPPEPPTPRTNGRRYDD